MIVTTIEPRIALPAGPPRSEGIHVSRVIRKIAVDRGLLDPKWVEDLSLIEIGGSHDSWWESLDLGSRLRMSMGLAWEQWYLPQIPGLIHQPGEIEYDGIFLTDDGLSTDIIVTPQGHERWEMAVHECKLTYKSTNTVGNLAIPTRGGVRPNWMWETQGKCYCKARGCHILYIHVLFVCGDYSYPITPILMIWRLQFEQAEIDATWEQIINEVKNFRTQQELLA